MTKRGWLMGLFLTMFAVYAAPAQASPNLVRNGGFETGDFTGWSRTGDQTFNDADCFFFPAYEGNCSAFFGPVEATGGISQNIDVGRAGLPYLLSFALDTEGGTPSSFSVSFGGQTLLSLVDLPDTSWTVYRFGGTTTAASMPLTFLFREDVGFMLLDGVQLVVPEPATMGLLGAVVIGLFLSRRRRAVRREP